MKLYAVRYHGEVEPFGIVHAKNPSQVADVVDWYVDHPSVLFKEIKGEYAIGWGYMGKEDPHKYMVFEHSPSDFSMEPLFDEDCEKDEDDDDFMTKEEYEQGWMDLSQYGKPKFGTFMQEIHARVDARKDGKLIDFDPKMRPSNSRTA